jgi:hypothetical protein
LKVDSIYVISDYKRAVLQPVSFHLHQSFFIMKNVVLSFAALFLLTTALTSCKKEKTFQDELVGRWLSVQVTTGGVDQTSSYSYDLNLEESQEFSLDVTTTVPFTGKVIQTFSGDWTEDQTKQDVTLNYTDGDKKTWDIVALSETSLTAELIESNIRYQVKFERQ